ncbi:MAG: ABC transporter permease subunit, partial [Firmicutes bacterium]|nr:ABC transporter permease subunit [Bacillota bacterium]
NLILELVPLMTLMLGTQALAGDREDATRELLAAYAVPARPYLAGKAAGLLAVLAAVEATGFGAYALADALAGGPGPGSLAGLAAFSFGLTVLYLAWALWLGARAADRWQALTWSAAFWFLTVQVWPTLLVAVLSLLPYPWITPVLTALELVNPAELLRLTAVLLLGAGSVLGPAYLRLVQAGPGVTAALGAVWAGGLFLLAARRWERGRGI